MIDLKYLKAEQLLNWFSENGRDLPWRVKGGAHQNPYAVWISEIMLQQTTVKTVIPYFARWMEKFPDVQTLAQADLQDVLLVWQGLGYYTRAKKIHECAKQLMALYDGAIPNERSLLLKLPGIGPYTASSICAFAFNKPETVVDGNVIRVIARLYGLTHVVTKEEIYELAHPMTPPNQGADYASAIMDLGAMICTPLNPKCSQCPWGPDCIAYRKGLTASIPLLFKPEKKEKKGSLFLIQNKAGEYYIQKRTKKGLLFGLFEFPWEYDDQHPFQAPFQKTTHQITHVFTHFRLTLTLQTIHLETVPLKTGLFVHPSDFHNYPFSTLMKKVIQILPKSKNNP